MEPILFTGNKFPDSTMHDEEPDLKQKYGLHVSPLNNIVYIFDNNHHWCNCPTAAFLFIIIKNIIK